MQSENPSPENFSIHTQEQKIHIFMRSQKMRKQFMTKSYAAVVTSVIAAVAIWGAIAIANSTMKFHSTNIMLASAWQDTKPHPQPEYFLANDGVFESYETIRDTPNINFHEVVVRANGSIYLREIAQPQEFAGSQVGTNDRF